MATRGRKPKPSALQKLQGNPGRRALNDQEPQIEPSPIEPPDFLNEEARAEWARVCPLLFQARMITDLDRAIFASYCEAWATYVRACKDVAKFGTVLVSAKTKQAYQGPWVNVRSMADKQMRACAVELGLTPSSRTRIQVARETGQDETGKGRFFAKGLKVVG